MDGRHTGRTFDELLRCPRCGLSIRPRVLWLAAEHCPRCLARARLAVPLVSSTTQESASAAPLGDPPEPAAAEAHPGTSSGSGVVAPSGGREPS